MKRPLERLKREIDDLYSGKWELPITSEVSPEEICRRLAVFDFRNPVPLEEALDEVAAMLRQWTQHNQHTRHFGLFTPATEFSGVAADALAALYNPQLATWDMAPAANEIERWTLSAIFKRFGIDPESGIVSFTSGGAEANHTAAVMALTRRFPRYGEDGLRSLSVQPLIYISEEGHHSFEKIAHKTGIGRLSLRSVPARRDLKLDVPALQAMIEEDINDGKAPFMVVATAGTTNAGAIDPLPEIDLICKRYGLWFHVDAAWGGAAALSDRLRPELEGIERADSITCDAHKWLGVPNAAGMFYSCHREIARVAFRTAADYVPPCNDDGRVYPFLDTMQWSRRFIGLKVFLMMAELGIPRLAARIERMTDLGDHMRRRLQQAGWKLLNPTPLPVVCFTHPKLEGDDRLTGAFADRIQKSQIAYITKTRLRGRTTCLRACITNRRTQEEDVDHLVEGLNECLERVGLQAAGAE